AGHVRFGRASRSRDLCGYLRCERRNQTGAGACLFVLEAQRRRALGAFPSPLWGGVRGGGGAIDALALLHARPPSPTLPHKGGGSRPSSPRVLIPFHPKAH